MAEPADWIEPDWPAPRRVRALVTTRNGGVSRAPYASLNLGTRVGDDPEAVAENRARAGAALPSKPKWLHQVHGVDVVQAERADADACADAAFTRARDVVCVIQVADCLPVLLCDREGTRVAAAHAGWRGLSAGVLERTVAALDLLQKRCWHGSVRPSARARSRLEWMSSTLSLLSIPKPPPPSSRCGKASGWPTCTRSRVDRLARAGVSAVYGGGFCTFGDPARFFSHRRDRVTGRQAAFIWLGD